MSHFSKRMILAALLIMAAVSPVVFAQDVITVGTVSTDGPSVNVPVYIRDVSGTALGMDKPAPARIQSLSLKVNYSPAAAVSSVTFTRSGITASLTPTFETSPSAAGSRSLLMTFQQSSDPIPFTSNKAAPGDQVARLTFTLSASAEPGTFITLTLDPSLTQLTDEGGTAATKETVPAGNLQLVSGKVNINPLSLSFTPSSLSVPRGTTGKLTVKTSANVASSTTVNLASSKTDIATVPASVVIAAGKNSGNVSVTGVALGKANITASLTTGATATAAVTVTEPADPCAAPASPEPSAPATVASGAPYTVDWPAVGNATDYVIEEAQNESFTGSTPAVVTGTSRDFAHSVTSDTRFYYRLQARNRASGCDSASPQSQAISVLVQAPPVPPPAVRVLPVVSSTEGQSGSHFKTSVQFYNASDAPIRGRILFHRAGTPGAEGDPAYPFALAARKTLTIDDLLPAIGLTGAGTAEIVADSGSRLPVSSIRIFNDAGAAGTSGFAGSALRPEDALTAGQTGTILAPADFVRFRLNVGIRTLEQPVTLTITARDRDGNIVRSLTRSYPAVFFEQTSATGLLDGLTLSGGESISFTVTSGSAFVYGATTDNTTNDPSMQLATPDL